MARKILIIDDEQDMRLYLQTLFRTAGFETAVAANGIEGVETARSFGPDLITLDIMMPRRSGVKAYGQLRADEATRDIPVVVLTGLTRQSDFFGDDLEGVAPPEAIVEKPIEREAFLRQVESILERR